MWHTDDTQHACFSQNTHIWYRVLPADNVLQMFLEGAVADHTIVSHHHLAPPRLANVRKKKVLERTRAVLFSYLGCLLGT